MAQLNGPIRIRRGTSTQWADATPTLAQGELGYETNSGRFKIGDGLTTWVDLPYQAGGGTERIILPAHVFQPFVGSPTFASAMTGHPFLRYWAMDASSAEGVNTITHVPAHWQTFDAYIWTVTPSAVTSNAVRWATSIVSFDVGDRVGASTSIAPIGYFSQTVSASAENVAKQALNPDVPAVSLPIVLNVYRDAANGADTYGADIGFVAYEMVRTS